LDRRTEICVKQVRATVGLRRWGALALAVGALVAGGCGGPSEEQRLESRNEELAKLRTTLETRLSEQAEGQKQACATAIGGFVDEVTGLDSRLDLGISYADYASKVSDAKVAYDRVSRSLTGGCYNAAKSAERALNQYVRAYSIWQDCIDSDYCTTDDVESEIRSHWAPASLDAAKAKRTLDRVGSGQTVGSKEFPVTDGLRGATIYGAIERLVCSPPDPPAAEAPCTELRNLLAGGVSEEEKDDVDQQVKELVNALGLNPS
jgi:hypothetical protein